MEKEIRILIVDDDKSILKFMRSILEKNNYYVNTADTAEKALEKLQRSHYDLTLLDIKLPDMNGIKLLGRMKDRSMVKIIVTGFPSRKNAIDSVNLGADCSLIKPVKPTNLLRIVEEKLEKRKHTAINSPNVVMSLLGDYLGLLRFEQSI